MKVKVPGRHLPFPLYMWFITLWKRGLFVQKYCVIIEYKFETYVHCTVYMVIRSIPILYGAYEIKKRLCITKQNKNVLIPTCHLV